MKGYAATSSSDTTLRPGNATLVTDTAAPIAINKFTDPVNGGTKDFKLRRSRVGTTTVTELFNLTDDEYKAMLNERAEKAKKVTASR